MFRVVVEPRLQNAFSLVLAGLMWALIGRDVCNVVGGDKPGVNGSTDVASGEL